MLLNRYSLIRRWFVSTGLMALIVATTSASVVSQDADTPKGAPTNWYRHVFQIQKAGEFDTTAAVSLPATCKVWLNGQRLKPKGNPETARGFEVSRLIRNGANCLAVEHRSSATQLPVALLRNGQPVSATNWRMKSSQPPVGWQKTDFNDKNWQAVKVQSPKLNWATLQVQPFTVKSTASRFQNGQFRFRDDDHVALLGGTFIERAQQFGHLEAALMSSEAQGLTFRNLGWSADTVFAESRGIFDSPAKGYARMIEHLRAEEPDVVLIAYGQNEAMQETSKEDAVRFQQQFKKLIADVQTTSAEVVLVTPHPFLTPVAPLPDARMWNPALKRYSKTIQAIAQQTSCHCVNLFDDFEQRLMQATEAVGFWPSGLQADEHPELRDALLHSLSDNGMHWNERGYQCVSMLFAESLFGKPQDESSGVTRFQLSSQYDQLLQLLVKKNELYFHRWRPQNITYLFGFRKHEQGNNASDIAKFDPLIVELEQQIQALRNSDGPTGRLELK